MGEVFNIYCDESCHLEHDHQQAMVLGAIWCPLSKTAEIAKRIREIKAKHKLSLNFEIKSTKVSPAKIDFYMDVLDYFFDDDDLHFRALIVPDKAILRHDDFKQDHDTWYYKMYFQLLSILFSPGNTYRIYLDIKDNCGEQKRKKLHEVLCNNAYDFERRVIERLQVVRSHEVEQIQLADLLVGILSYVNRSKNDSLAKLKLVSRMQQRSKYTLTRKTLIREEKVNILRWEPGT